MPPKNCFSTPDSVYPPRERALPRDSRRSALRLAPWCLVVALVTACGGGGGAGAGGTGGGGGGGGGGGNTVSTGTLGDGIAGVRFETPTQQGVTDANGAFRFQKGERVRFTLGGTELGELPADSKLSLFDLAGTGRIEGPRALRERLRDGSFWKLLNVVVLMHTFDHDGDPANGIEISSDLAALAKDVTIDVGTLRGDFRNNRAFRGLLNDANAAALFPEHRIVRSGTLALQSLYDHEPALFEEDLTAVDMDVDGVPEEIVTVIFEPRGFPALRTDTTHPNGVPAEEVREFEYGAAAELLFASVDTENDGTIDRFTELTYDGDGELVSVEQRDENGVLTGGTHFMRNVFGDPFEIRTDKSGNGMADVIQFFEFDERGNRTRIAFDFDADGAEDRVITRSYDERDREILQLNDEDGDGVDERAEASEYDEADQRIREEIDEGVDGVIDLIRSFSYDSAGRLIRIERDNDADGVADDISTYEYDEHGNQVRFEVDSNADGNPDRIDLAEYSEESDLLREEQDFDGDGTPNRITVHSYDEHGNRIRSERDTDADGLLDQVVERSFVPVGWGGFFQD